MQHIMPNNSSFLAKTFQDWIHLMTNEAMEFVDITDQVASIIGQSGIRNGIVNVQTLHTTTAILINEHEPQLLQDMKELLDRLAPKQASYRHDDFTVRTVNLVPEEVPNGHAHCRALFLRTSETINVAGGQMDLGRWQRIFFMELDRPKQRTVSVLILGL